ncbi:protein YhfH [Bacillus sp. SD088]|nr:protein YhfH [Bacillus sp. SD088]MBO0993635.1 YhfH family protein [Bacillus sp. SD088]
MIASIVEFFKELPPKKCSQCGEKIVEQHECYGNLCDQCNSI